MGRWICRWFGHRMVMLPFVLGADNIECVRCGWTATKAERGEV